jgi:uncharacterized membrane protein
MAMVPEGKGKQMDFTGGDYAWAAIGLAGLVAGLVAATAAAVAGMGEAMAIRRSRRAYEARRARRFSHAKHGGLHFIRAGRFGAAVWISRR